MHRYRYVLALILISLAFQLAAPSDDWARAVTILLQGATLVLALRVARAHDLVTRVVSGIVVIAIVAAGLTLIGEGEDRVPLLITNLLVIGLAPPAIAVGVVRDARATRAITVPTMFGVLCIYLLLGMLFAFVYDIVEQVGSEPFFDAIREGTPSDFLYFSFATLTTVGYGDLVAATDVGRSIAITEALLGQIYLVTVVALIVANIGRGGPGPQRA
jgi:hypothetical protein